MNLEKLKNVPILAEYLARISQIEDGLQQFKIKLCDLKLNNNGTATVQSPKIDSKLPINKGVNKDLANIGEIPVDYYENCDAPLQAFSFNYRVNRLFSPEISLTITVKDNELYRISNSKLLEIPRTKILNTISNSKSEKVDAQKLHVIQYAYNGSFDLSIINPDDLQSEPLKGDILAFGVNVRGSRQGAIQVQEAAYRLFCKNGAINRICSHKQHHLNRPGIDGLSEAEFLENIAEVSTIVWNEWGPHAESLEQLTKITIDISNMESLTKKLTAKPFFISLKNVKLIIDYLKEHHNGRVITLYDLYNAMTFLGSHQTDLPYNLRMRLRLGDGEISRRNSRICDLCHQLIMK